MADIPLDIDDTSNCPVEKKCEACGSEDGDLSAATVNTGFSVLCLTLCDPCIDGELPPFNVITAAKRGLLHAGHVNLDLDQIAAVLDAERLNSSRNGLHGRGL